MKNRFEMLFVNYFVFGLLILLSNKLNSQVNAERTHVVSESNTSLDDSEEVKKSSENSGLVLEPLDVNGGILLSRYLEKPILYAECQNNYQILLPKSSKKYLIKSISDTSGSHIVRIEKDSIKGVYSLIPDSKGNGIAKIGVYKKKKLVKEFQFVVKKVPPVEIEEMNDLKSLMKNGLSVYGRLTKLEFKAVTKSPDFEFLCPRDNRFVVRGVEITLAKGRRPAMPTWSSQNGEIDLNKAFEIVRNDTLDQGAYRLIIEVNKVQHINFCGKSKDVHVSNFIFTIPLY
jgi:hypothetical protein